jgi:hypothetical protein
MFDLTRHKKKEPKTNWKKNLCEKTCAYRTQV